MADLIIRAPQREKAAVAIRQAIETEIARLNHSLQRTQKQLEGFENKYRVTSEQFIQHWSAEDLDGKDIEYIEWAGEYHCLLAIQDELKTLQRLEYVSE